MAGIFSDRFFIQGLSLGVLCKCMENWTGAFLTPFLFPLVSNVLFMVRVPGFGSLPIKIEP